jgi:coatomer protein complex subunit epsilon
VPARILKLRSQIALGQAKDVASALAKETTPDLVAIRLLAEYESGKDVVSDVKKLVEKEGQSNLAVQIVGGIVLEREGLTEEALAVLSKHEGSLDA